MKLKTTLAASLALAAFVSWGFGAQAQERLPIFDTHVHYSRPAWTLYPPASVAAILDAAGVRRALVSSSPDDGTLMLYRHDSDRVVPILRPYREGVTPGNWVDDPGLSTYLEERLRTGAYRGIGEVHLFDDGSAATPQVRRAVELAVERDIVVHVHSGAGPVRALFALEPRLKVLWAHAGMSEPPEVVGALLDRQAGLWTEVSFRAADIAPDGRIAPGWRDLFLRHPDRLMIGTDTYTTSRWDAYRSLVEEHRRWLALLPKEVAEAIAHGNADRLFGAGVGK
ncbi:MAG: amidohydrolase family protein [Pseudomonadota bacterium]